MIGTYADGVFTMTRPPVPVPVQTLGEASELDSETDLETPCAAPPGGWRVIDSERTTDESLEQSIEIAQNLPGFSDVWVDETKLLVADIDLEDDFTDDDSDDGADEAHGMNDPEILILNVAVTSDPARAETALRKTWGGALCVSHARHTARELRRIRHTLEDQPGLLSASSGRDHVDLEVVYDDGSLQNALDERYPRGLIRITSALKPYLLA